MSALVIESSPLTPEQAHVLIAALNSVTVKAESAEDVLRTRLALERIVAGEDTVVPRESQPRG